MDEVVFICKIHGDCTENHIYRSKDKKCVEGFRFKCKECTRIALHRRPCPVHGMIGPEDRYHSGQCRVCAYKRLKESNDRLRNNNRTEFNEKQRLKRQADPEKYAEMYKKKHLKSVEKYGQEFLSQKGRATQKGLRPEQLRYMIEKQNNLCAICGKTETRIFKDRISGEMKIMNLCIDHDHITGLVRALLCHDCNTGLGKFKDDVNLLQTAIEYLKKHQNQ